MSRAIFPAAYFAGVILTSAVRVVYTRRYRQTPIARDYRKGMDALLSALPGLGMFVLPVIYVLTGWLDFADYHLPVWAGWLGVMLFALAVWLLWPGRQLVAETRDHGRALSCDPGSVPPHPAPHVRCPLALVAQVFLLQNWIAGFSMLVCMLPLYVYRARIEEETMVEQFGDEYREYMARTGRIFPRLC